LEPDNDSNFKTTQGITVLWQKKFV